MFNPTAQKDTPPPSPARPLPEFITPPAYNAPSGSYDRGQTVNDAPPGTVRPRDTMFRPPRRGYPPYLPSNGSPYDPTIHGPTPALPELEYSFNPSGLKPFHKMVPDEYYSPTPANQFNSSNDVDMASTEQNLIGDWDMNTGLSRGAYGSREQSATKSGMPSGLIPSQMTSGPFAEKTAFPNTIQQLLLWSGRHMNGPDSQKWARKWAPTVLDPTWTANFAPKLLTAPVRQSRVNLGETGGAVKSKPRTLRPVPRQQQRKENIPAAKPRGRRMLDYNPPARSVALRDGERGKWPNSRAYYQNKARLTEEMITAIMSGSAVTKLRIKYSIPRDEILRRVTMFADTALDVLQTQGISKARFIDIMSRYEEGNGQDITDIMRGYQAMEAKSSKNDAKPTGQNMSRKN